MDVSSIHSSRILKDDFLSQGLLLNHAIRLWSGRREFSKLNASFSMVARGDFLQQRNRIEVRQLPRGVLLVDMTTGQCSGSIALAPRFGR